jgi:4-amino-4-deoxy-L-arabinose transferase-like glycosyltransferase
VETIKELYQKPALRWALWAVVVALLALRLIHLSADFPNFAFWWDDAAKYSDEGWYANAALNSVLMGHWYIPGDWAPATVVPVWPAILTGIFHVTGVSIVVARATEVVFSWAAVFLSWMLFRRFTPDWLAAIFAFLLAASAMTFAFSRVAVLEAPLETVILLALLLSTNLRRQDTGRCVLLGMLLVLIVLTKTSGAFVIPAILYPIVFRYRTELRAAARPLAIGLLTTLLLYGAERFLFARHYAADARVFFSRSVPGIGIITFEKTVRLLYRGTWIDPFLWPLVLFAVTFSIWMRSLWRQLLWGVSVLWCVGYSAFIIYHVDGPPRYFGTMTIPVVMLALLFLQVVWQRWRFAGEVVLGIILFSVGWNLWQIEKVAFHPQYVMLRAANEIRSIVLANPDAPHLLMGHGDSQITIYNGIPGLDDTFGTMTVEQKYSAYKPGWVVMWNDENFDGFEEFLSKNDLVRVAVLPAFDDPGRNRLIVYRIVPKSNGNSLRGAVPTTDPNIWDSVDDLRNPVGSGFPPAGRVDATPAGSP